ncbi:amidohydrolase family protein [Psychroserpens sp. SPM9]|uniref:metal-dependent hydrolase family protein n=1 Tax=Psychroserpens sp. SPM9 TaxID=2975598 RepID=UPI0021A4FFBE|nr:amidohydrolase family protein [Psychroserpens sp. SPM9]MDG5492898.1 amidohydrolase family protein [Psychroserpens sp. SPM9]
MNKLGYLVMSLIFLFVLHGTAQQKEVFIKAGLLYDSEQNTLLKNKGIHIIGNKIQSIKDGNDIPKGVEVIDLSEYTVLPGLIDAHTHVLFSQEASEDLAKHSMHTLTMESDALRTLRGAKRAKSYLFEGFTSIKDLGNSGPFLDVALRDAINEGTIEGPRIFASGQIMSSTGGQIYGVPHNHQDIINLEYRVIKNVEDAKNAVREHLNQNVDVIKICSDNIPNNTRLTIDEMKAIVETAHSYGLSVTAHAITNQSTWDAVQAGVDGIEHGVMLEDSTLVLMAKKQVYLVPTENSRNYMIEYNKLAGNASDDIDWIDAYLNNMKDRLTKAINYGVPIVAGSDNYTKMAITRGQSSKDMFRAYFEAGMKPLDILQSTTYISAKYLKREDRIGVIKPNAYADIIAVKGNLKSDFVNTVDSIVFVMKDGKIHLNSLEQNLNTN